MRKAILVGNGFTSQLISSYMCSNMMGELQIFAPEIYVKIEELFNPFRKTIDSLEYTSVAAGACGMMVCGAPSLYQPITDIVYNNEIKIHVKSVLEGSKFQNVDALYVEYFEEYGLIYETQKKAISNNESALKVVSLFMKIGKFTEDEYIELKKVSDTICYNNGNCEVTHIERSTSKCILSCFLEFDEIYTTNYDLVLDSVFNGKKRIRHLHGGFSSYDLLSYTKLKPSEAFLVWGINKVEKENEMRKQSSFQMFDFNGSRLIRDLYSLGVEKYDELHIFGYSGENDDHINNKIRNNPNITQIIYYANPNNCMDEKVRFKVNRILNQDKLYNRLKIRPWSDIWEKLL